MLCVRPCHCWGCLPSDIVNEWPSDQMTKWQVTEWSSDQMTRWPSYQVPSDRMTGSFADDWPDGIFSYFRDFLQAWHIVLWNCDWQYWSFWQKWGFPCNASVPGGLDTAEPRSCQSGWVPGEGGGVWRHPPAVPVWGLWWLWDCDRRMEQHAVCYQRIHGANRICYHTGLLIKLFTQGTFKLLFQTPDILSDWEFRTFWIRTELADPQFTISVGRGGETAPFMSHTFDYQQHAINYVAFSSYIGHSAEWYILPHQLEVTTQDYAFQYYSTFALSSTRGIHPCKKWYDMIKYIYFV